MKTIQTACVFTVALLLSACVGVRGGWESRLATEVPAELGLVVEPLNRIQDHEFRPLPFAAHVGAGHGGPRYRFSVAVQISPAAEGLRFDPQQAVVRVPGLPPMPLADAHPPGQPQAYVLDVIDLAAAPARTQLLLNFNMRAPDAGKPWVLDLSQAFRRGGGTPVAVPPMQFEPQRWRVGY